MKKIFTYIFGIFAIIVSCHEPYHTPVEACFEVDMVIYEMGEEIQFNNCSLRAERFIWDFGDGYSSESVNPTYTYTKPGEYKVALTAFNEDERDVKFLTIKILAPTVLSVRVMFYGTPDPVSDCQVQLFDNKQDFDNLKNSVIYGYSDNHGDIEFVNVRPIIYYIDAYKKSSDGNGYYSNFKGYETYSLEPNSINYYDVFVEYTTNKSARKLIVKSIEPRKKK